MEQSILPPIFKELLREPQNELIQKAAESGRRIIGYTCSYIPEPILSVDGLVPTRMRAPGVAGTEMADTYLSSVICPYTRSLLEYALAGTYDFLDGWVFTASCDHLRRLHDNLNYLISPSFNHMIDLPHKLSDQAVAWYRDELQMLAEALAKNFDVDTGEKALAASIARHNEYLELMNNIGNLRKQENPPLNGTDFHTLLVALSTSPKEMIMGDLRELHKVIPARDGINGYRARLMVVGSQLDEPGYLEIIESMGGLVVADRFCLGSIPGLDPIPETEEPLQALAEHYLRRTSCPRMMEEFNTRVETIINAVREYRVDGVLVETLKFCDTWGIESVPLVAALREADIPVLKIEREYSMAGEGQLRTRVQAFLESMGK